MALLYWKRFQIPERWRTWFYLLGTGFILTVKLLEFEAMFYSTNLWIQYTIFVMLATMLFNTQYPIKEAICLGFLTAFLNSYYWELPVHIADYIATFPNWLNYLGVFIPQWVRLLPLMYLIPNYTYKPTAKTYLIAGFMQSTCILILREVFFHGTQQPKWILARFMCLLILVKIILDAEPNPATHLALQGEANRETAASYGTCRDTC